MYHEFYAAAMFGERHRALLEEAEGRRLARKLRAAKRSTQEEQSMGRLRRTALVFAAVVMAVLVSATAALAEIRVGTDNSETLVGTNSADHLTGMGGDDTLKGLARDDTYHFDEGSGYDTLTEKAFVKVGTKKLPGGTDTLDFSEFGGGNLTINMVPQWGEGYNGVLGPNEHVDLGSSPVENAVGGSGNDTISGGSAKNTLNGGPGGHDALTDWGGYGGDPNFPALPTSDDTYKGFTSATGHDLVMDYGGKADKLDLRPLEFYDVYFERFDSDADNSEESLRIVMDADTSVEVIGYFSPLPGQQNGRMEQIIFSNETITSNAQLNSLM